MHALLVYGAPAALAALIALFIALRRRRPALPDYFALSGVPPPKPLPHFNVDTAKPRPYRPFRWAYFQHMGAYILISPRMPPGLTRLLSSEEDGA